MNACSVSSHQEYYQQAAPKKFPKTGHVNVFLYGNKNIDSLYEILFSDLLVIGKSSFVGPYEKPNTSTGFAKSIGADLIVINYGDAKSHIQYSAHSNTTKGAQGQVLTKTSINPVSTRRYRQQALFLKNVTSSPMLWEQTTDHYKKTHASPIAGIWENESYSLRVYQSEDLIVGSIESVIPIRGKVDYDSYKLLKNKIWKNKDVKFVFDVENKSGVYLMRSGAPYPANFEINKFGNLDINLVGEGETFSFQRRDI